MPTFVTLTDVQGSRDVSVRVNFQQVRAIREEAAEGKRDGTCLVFQNADTIIVKETSREISEQLARVEA